MNRVLLRGGCVLTMGQTNYSRADVLIEGSTIVEVGPAIRARDAETIDATDTIVMPGMVDAHRHVAEGLFRNLGASFDSATIEGHYSPDDTYAATLLGLLGALEAGITTVVDWCGVAADTAHLTAAIEAHRDSGIRSVVIPAPGRDWVTTAQEFATTAVGPLQTRAAGAPSLEIGNGWATVRRSGMRIHAHAGPGDGAGRVSAVAAGGLLGPDVTLVHGSVLDDADLEAVAAASCAVVLTPAADMAAGQPAAPVQGLIDRGIRPGLGVDREHLAPGDVFAQMHAVISMQHATVFDRKLAGKAGLPKLLTTREVIRYATVDGAAAAGLGGSTGVIEPGRQADIILLRTDRPNIHPVNDPIGAVVWGMDTSNVDWVFVAGEARKREGRATADLDRARALAIAARERLDGREVAVADRGAR